MSTKNNGGPAFPAHPGVSFLDGEAPNYAGMSLRDYFAAEALKGAMACPRRWTINRNKPDVSDSKRSSVCVNSGKRYAELAYRIADAMLAERAK